MQGFLGLNSEFGFPVDFLVGRGCFGVVSGLGRTEFESQLSYEACLADGQPVLHSHLIYLTMVLGFF